MATTFSCPSGHSGSPKILQGKGHQGSVPTQPGLMRVGQGVAG